MRRYSFKSLLAGLLSCLLVLLSIAPAASASAPSLTDDEAVALLQAYGVVQGDEYGNLNLDKPITRAEASKIFVATMGSSSFATLLKDSVRYSDAKGHWAAGFIEMASRLDLMKGRGDNQFDPQANISNAEVYTVILRMVGREPQGPWNPALIMSTAQELGLLPNIPVDSFATAPALRGVVFRSLGRAVATIPLADGNTVAQKYLDSNPPEVAVNLPTSTVSDSITVSGTAQGARTVTINGVTAALQGNQFSGTASLSPGVNSITIEAWDMAGNRTQVVKQISRSGDAARIEVSGANRVKAGDTIVIRAQAYDVNNVAFPVSAVSAAVEGGIGTYDVKTGVFQAGNKAGSGLITFTAGQAKATFAVSVLGPAEGATALRIRSVNNGKPLSTNERVPVQVEILDKDGAFLAYDEGRTVTMQVSGEGAALSPGTATTSEGVATFYLSGVNPTELKLTATANGLSAAKKSVFVASDTRIVLSAPEKSVADGTTPVTIKAMLTDRNGTALTNTTGKDIVIKLSTESSTSSLITTTLTIRDGSKISGDATIIPGLSSETVRVNGVLQSTHDFTVVPAIITMEKISIGSPAKLQLIGGGRAAEYPSASNEVELGVEVVDSNGNVVPTGSYAFQVKVTTSNGEDLVNGLPEGVNLTLGDTGETIAAAAEDAVIARTTNGRATLKLTYIRSGKVTVTLVGAKATSEGLDSSGKEGNASSSSGLTMGDRAITFAANAAGVEMVVDIPSLKLTEQPDGILPANNRATATVKVYAVDSEGGRVPGHQGQVTLKRLEGGKGGTRLSGSSETTATASMKDGVAQFTLVATKNVGADEWEATLLGVATNDKLTVTTVGDALDRPVITSTLGDVSGQVDRITPSDEALQIRFNSYDDAVGVVKVYKTGSTTPIYTSDVMPLTGLVEVPKDVLPVSDRYAMVVNNGYGDSEKSEFYPFDSAARVVKEKDQRINIYNVRYDAGREKLSASTDASLSSSGTIDTSLLHIYDADDPSYKVYLSGATCTIGSRSFTCDLSGFGLTASEFSGGAVLGTEDGWYSRASTGESAHADTTLGDNRLTPMAHVTHAGLEVLADGSGRLTLYGRNLNQGKIYPNKIMVDSNTPLGSSKYVTSTNPKEAVIPLTATQVGELTADATLTASVGWLVSSSGDQNPAVAFPVFKKANIKRVQYTNEGSGKKLIIWGAGFSGTSVAVNVAQLELTNRSGSPIPGIALSSSRVIDDASIEITLTDPENKIEDYLGNAYLTSKDGDPSWLEIDGWSYTPLNKLQYRISR